MMTMVFNQGHESSWRASGRVLFPFSVRDKDSTGREVGVLRHHEGAIVHRTEPMVPNLPEPEQNERDKYLAPGVFTGDMDQMGSSPRSS